MHPVVITGLGCICGLGTSVAAFREALWQGRCGIGPLTSAAADGRPNAIGAQVPRYCPDTLFDYADRLILDRFSQFALIASQEALKDAGLELDGSLSERTAAIIGTGCGGKETDEATYQQLLGQGHGRLHPLTIPRGMPSAAVSQVSMRLGIRGPTFAVTSACSSANHAIAQAFELVRSGAVDAALAGGTDAPFTLGLMKAWEAMRVLSKDTCRPFTKDRSGMVLGEGAGILVLESLEHAQGRGARIYAKLAGYGMSADAGHITAPSCDGAVRAMRAALVGGGLNPEDIDYVNAHGTGTVANDRTETQALHKVFGDHARRLAVSSTKSMHAHALGAAGALEAIATTLALHQGIVPPTANFTEPGEDCDLDYVPNEARRQRIGSALSNSFAFGGLNAVLALKSA